MTRLLYMLWAIGLNEKYIHHIIIYSWHKVTCIWFPQISHTATYQYRGANERSDFNQKKIVHVPVIWCFNVYTMGGFKLCFYCEFLTNQWHSQSYQWSVNTSIQGGQRTSYIQVFFIANFIMAENFQPSDIIKLIFILF